MPNHTFTLSGLQTVEAAVVDLLMQQEQRTYACDPRIALPRDRDQIVDALEWHLASPSDQPPLVVRDAARRPRAYAYTEVWHFGPENEMAAFYATFSGLTRYLALPAATDPDAGAVLATLLMGLDARWAAQGTEGQLFTWLAADPWPQAQLQTAGFEPDNILALRDTSPLPASRPSLPDLRTRLAQPQDAETLVALHLAELEFHVPHSPFVRMIPALEVEFRKRLTNLWAGDPEAALIVVVERGGEVMAMAESTLEVLPGWLSHFRLPGERYGYLNSVSVRAELRGQGVGRVLVQGVLDAFQSLQVDGYVLWFTHSNPLSSQFWPHLGFTPLWTQYQRRR